MKQVFFGILVVLVALSFVALLLEPRAVNNGKMMLLWTSDDNPARREQLSLFNQMYPRYHVDLDPSNSDMQKVIVQSLAGNGPDVLDCYSPDQLSAYVKSGIAWDVTDELKRRGIDVSNNIWPIDRTTCMMNGRVYGAPTNAGINALWVNKALFEKDGIPLPKGPWTWDQFIPIAQKLTHRDASGRVTQWGAIMDWSNWEQFAYQYGGRVYTPDGTRCIVDSPAAIRGVQLFRDLTYKYKVLPSPSEQDAMATAGGWGSGTITLFQGGTIAMAYGGRWWLCTLRKEPDLQLDAVECPYPRDGYRVFTGAGKCTLINAKSPRREQALTVLEYIQSAQFTHLINHQADALGPVPKYCMGNDFLHDPAYPQEDFNSVWLNVMKYGVLSEISPYINAQEAERIMTQQIDLIKANQKPTDQALRDAAAQVNAEIKQNVEKDPALRAQYLKATGGKMP